MSSKSGMSMRERMANIPNRFAEKQKEMLNGDPKTGREKEKNLKKEVDKAYAEQTKLQNQQLKMLKEGKKVDDSLKQATIKAAERASALDRDYEGVSGGNMQSYKFETKEGQEVYDTYKSEFAKRKK